MSEPAGRHRQSASGDAASSIDLVLFDIGGVLGSNGWDREQRAAAVKRFGLDAEDFQYRHEETIGAFESGDISLDEYLDVTVFCERRDFTTDEFKAFMFEQSEPWWDSIAVARDLADAGRVRLGTLNNESEALNVHRIETFGLSRIFRCSSAHAGWGYVSRHTRSTNARSAWRRRAGRAPSSWTTASRTSRRRRRSG